MHTSLWAATGPTTDYPPLDASIEADVLVVGAGITGLVTALLLQREGLGVTVIDQHRVGAGVTGYTTGKLSSLHQLVYSELSNTFGVEGARTYAEANEAGLACLADLVEELGARLRLPAAAELHLRRLRRRPAEDPGRGPRGRRGGARRLIRLRRATPVSHRGRDPRSPTRPSSTQSVSPPRWPLRSSAGARGSSSGPAR